MGGLGSGPRARRAMLGGSSGAREREAEGDAAGALPAPPAIDFPAEGSDPKYDGEGSGPPLSPVRLHSRGRGRAASSEVRPESGQFRLHPGLHRGPSGAVRGAAGGPFGSGKLGLRQVSASRSFVYISVPWFPLCGLRASEVLRLARAAFQLPGPVVLSGGEHELFKTTRMGLCRSFVPDSLG